ncbi:MAG TPA: phospholipase D-like domain-containing protein [Terriglobales bacterium]|nr:phospholipase D-like domain-containing protein [Terriglobales bacterium]
MGRKLNLLVLVVLLAACGPTSETVVFDGAQPAIRVYFTAPTAPEASSVRGGPDEQLAAAIDEARLSVDVAIYNLDLYGIRDALIAAHDRGLNVRMVIEQDYAEGEAFQKLAAAGISVLFDKNADYMHDKFVVIDRYEVWTGSMNYTVGDVYWDRNNLVAIKSTRLAQNYETEFNEMYLGQSFGASSPADTPYPLLNLNGVIVENYFAPEDRTLDHLVSLVNGAKKSVYFLAFSFTSDELALAVIAANDRGLDVRGVLDKGQATSNAGGEYGNLLAAGVDLRQDGEVGNLHDKVLIIDGEIVVTGSYNFSTNAEKRNDENTLVMHDAEIAAKYLVEFELIWSLAE